ncbi:B12-binding domain-containing radical SAM protein [Methanonatronarchaeum sp. AMET6-2]|uniref:B12-binding domain-containing radical SAM protein n=1 Tax=Methanonatronarchaeum sp. AMET6-2 TaxID=2933293 RepID=UPI00121F6BF7|nr:radical SAM protein [Methanonatronarchaeum sp. AMET6-2]RZN61868.1 MAG: radical SAM protein [Methanonatronarchaeia archaeon]UOY10239.1 B12-binding domain-containing radical SAM protein [Methanonatronarchaeum sp. AMET6-2]
MKVLLVQPHAAEELVFKEVIGLTVQPMGLAYIASSLERDGHEVRIMDMPAEDKDMDDFIGELKDYRPDVLGLYIATYRSENALELTRASKKVLPEITTICGGPHSSMVAEELVQNRSIDIVVCGEGEVTIRRVLQELGGGDLGGVRGIVYMDGDTSVSTEPRELVEDLDSLPWPSRRLFDRDRYRLMDHLDIATIVSSRGCTYGCNYCTVPALYGNRWRARSPEDVVDEMIHVEEKYDPDIIMFLDDNFDLDEDRVWSICDEIDRRGLEVPWGCLSGGLQDGKPELTKRMSEAGCRVIGYNLEAGSEKSIDTLNRGVSLDEAREALRLSGELGMIRILNIVIGFPGEDEEDIKQAIQFAKDVNVEFPLFFLPTPYPGTEFHRTAKRQGMIEELDWEKYTTMNPVIETEYLDLDKLRQLNREAYRECYLSIDSVPRYLNMTKNVIRDGWIDIQDLPRLFVGGSMMFLNISRF